MASVTSDEKKNEGGVQEEGIKETPVEPVLEQGAAGGQDQKPMNPREKLSEKGSGTGERSPKGVPEERESGNEIIEKVVKIGRVSKVVKGGKNFSFNALVITGDGKGRVGIGFGKSNDVVGAITKGTNDAKKNMKKIIMTGDTIPHEIIGKFKATHVMLKPAGPGTGVIAGGPVRAMCDAVGIRNILTKSMGSRNPVNVVKAAMDGFVRLRLERRG